MCDSFTSLRAKRTFDSLEAKTKIYAYFGDKKNINIIMNVDLPCPKGKYKYKYIYI